MHLLSLDQPNDVQVSRQLLLALPKILLAMHGSLDAVAAEDGNDFGFEAAEEIADSKQPAIAAVKLEQLAVKNEFVQEVELLLFWFDADILLLHVMLDEVFDPFFVGDKVVRVRLNQ